MKETIQIEGQMIFAWIQKSDAANHALLHGSEFSNDEDVWIINSIDREWIEMETFEGAQVRRRLPFILNGTFFIEAPLSKNIEASIRSSMTLAELALDEVKNNLRSKGFHLNALRASHTEFLSSLLLEFQEHSYPDGATWAKLHDLIKDGAVENMRAIVPFLIKWIERSEAKLGMYDLSRRILLAIAFRHTGQFQKAVEVSEVVNEHGKYPNDQGCIAILCTTRSASLMDIAESGSSSPCEILARARKSLNRANAIRSSEEVMLTYRRMKTLDQRYGCEGGTALSRYDLSP
jgi:hypothetical protein